jgi:tetratricopeptide (TPR) repeat protein
MSALTNSTGEVFISFSSKDRPVGKLFSALRVQNVKCWDYSAKGQELPLGQPLGACLKSKIDSCDYFIAVISPNSIDPEFGDDAMLEVRYAIASGKKTRNRLLPLLLNNPSQWRDVYPEFRQDHTVWDVFDFENESSFENTMRRICEWLSVPYVPSSLRHPHAFFSNLLLAEIEGQEMQKADFVTLILQSDEFGRHMLNEEWSEALESTGLLISLAKRVVPPVSLHFPLVMRGFCELQLKQYATAEETFLQATTNQDLGSNPMLGLGYAGLGHTYASLQRFDESLTAFQKAVEFAADDYLHFTHQAAILSAGGKTVDQSVFHLFDDATLSPAERLKLITLKGALHYKNREYGQAITVFRDLRLEELDESATIFYSLALRENGEVANAIHILSSVAERTKSVSLYHYLADTYWNAGESMRALRVYEAHLCLVETPSDYARQLLVEYARMLRTIEGDRSIEARGACERAVDLKVLPLTHSKADFFYLGFAHYLLGKKETARYFFENSLGFSADYYDQIPL